MKKPRRKRRGAGGYVRGVACCRSDERVFRGVYSVVWGGGGISDIASDEYS